MSLSSHPERDALPARLRERLEGTLRDGEQLLWLGRPDAGRRARWEALRAASRGFSTLFVGAGLLAVSKPWELANPGVPVPPWLWAVAWGALGLVALSVCWGAFRALRRARRTAYAVTDQRALVCRDLLFSSGHSLERADVGLVRVRTWPGGRGEVHFEPRVAYERPARREEGATSFVYLNDVDDARRAVEQLLGRELPEEKFGRAAGDVPPRPDTSDVHELSDALRDRLHGELAEGERILWLGRPPPGTMMARAAIPAGCVFLLVTGCAGMLAAFVGVVGWFFPPRQPGRASSPGSWCRL